MLDIKFVRENPEALDAAMANRQGSWDRERFFALDEERRSVIAEVEDLQATRNAESKKIGVLMKEGKRDEAERARALQAARDAEADAMTDSHSTDGAATTGEPNPLVRQDPLVCDYERVEMATTPDNALVGMAYVIGDAADRKRLVAADVLIDALGTWLYDDADEA